MNDEQMILPGLPVPIHPHPEEDVIDDGNYEFTIFFEGQVTLHLSDIWPDKDHPKKPTATDVARLMRQQSKAQVLNDWDLFPYIEIWVDDVCVNDLEQVSR